MDLLTPALSTLKLEGALFCSSRFRPPWGLRLPADSKAHFHYVERGRAALVLGGESYWLEEGELIFLPPGPGYLLLDDPNTTAQPWEPGQGPEVANDGEGTLLVCGWLKFQNSPLLPEMPSVLRVDGRSEWLSPTLRLLAHEARNPGLGSEIITMRLIDVLFVQAIRSWLRESPPQAHWLGALDDRRLAPVLQAIHQFPQRSWDVASLARLASLSRSALSELFRQRVGQPVAGYLTSWRMQEAARLLSQEGYSVSQAAVAVGYASEPAFSRAFKRAHGRPPRHFRPSPQRSQ